MIIELQVKASAVLKLKNKYIPRRPIIIEFAGCPKSGKTSCINSLAMFLRRNKFRTRILTERASTCPIIGKHDPLFNTWTMASTVIELSEIIANNSKDYDVIILDRGFFDSLCWFNWMRSKNFIDDNNYEATCTFLKMRRWRSVIDLVYVFLVSPEESISREQSNLLTKKTGSIMQPKILESIKDAIQTTVKENPNMYRNLEEIDTTRIEITQVNYEVTNRALQILSETITESIAYIPRSSLCEKLPTAFRFSKANIKELEPSYEARTVVEESEDKVQLIPIVVITNPERSRVVVVTKKDSAAKRSAELGKRLLYFGGHLREEDGKAGGDILSIMKYGLSRELKEEVGLDYFPPQEQNDPLCIWYRAHERSRKHLAICFTMEADFETTKFRLDKNEFKTGKGSGSPMDIHKLKSEDLETWSKLILETLFASTANK